MVLISLAIETAATTTYLLPHVWLAPRGPNVIIMPLLLLTGLVTWLGWLYFRMLGVQKTIRASFFPASLN